MYICLFFSSIDVRKVILAAVLNKFCRCFEFICMYVCMYVKFMYVCMYVPYLSCCTQYVTRYKCLSNRMITV